jgi:hypothetical protein
MEEPYRFVVDDFAALLLRRFFPERTDGESAVIRLFLLEHLREFDTVSFSVRIGAGIESDPTHLPGVQRNAIFSGQKRIDILAFRGTQPIIIEVKQRVTPATLGQILTYRHLYLEENPDAPDPELVVAGRWSDDDTTRILQANGVTVYLYPDAKVV